MRSRTAWYCSLIVFASAALPGLRADTIGVGTANSASVAPFGDSFVTAFEQLYSSADFSTLTGTVDISELDFFVDPSAIPMAVPDPTLQPYIGQFQVTLSQADAGSLTGADLATNVQNDPGGTTVNAAATLDLTADAPGTVTSGMLALSLNVPFAYDPAKDLLLDVQQVGASQWTLFALQADSTLDSVGVSSDCSTATGVCDYGVGLVTNFIETPEAPTGPQPVPEPSAAGLLGIALAFLGIGALSRKSRAVSN